MTYQILPNKTALLLIDPQREYFDEGRPLYTPNAAPILENLVRLRTAADESGISTVIVTHVHKADGSDLGRMGDFDPTPVFVEGTVWVDPVVELTPRAKDLAVTKTRYSAFVGTKLHSLLERLGVDTLIVAGLMTNYCCVTTARHAHDLDYKVVFAADANAGPDMPDLGFGAVPHTEILRGVSTSLAGGVADVATTEEIISQMKEA